MHFSASGIYKSDDDGQTWVAKNIDPNIGGVFGIIQDNSDPSIFYAAVSTALVRGDVVYRSTDSGENWVLAGRVGDPTDNSRRPVGANAIIQVADGTLYIATADAYAQENVWQSTDQGDTWVGMGSIPGGTVVHDIIDTGDGSIFAALTNGDVIGSGFGPLSGSGSYDCLDGYYVTNIELDENDMVTLIECRTL